MKLRSLLFFVFAVGLSMLVLPAESSAQTWTLCAREGGTCTFSGTQQVRYGANGLYAYKTLTGGTAWRSVGEQLPLWVVGDGPLGPDVAAAAQDTRGIRWLGKRAPQDVVPLLQEATCLVFPSECYETFGRVIVEAFAAGTPVVAAGHGAAAELVTDGITGVHFRPGDAADLAAKVIQLNSHPALRERMRVAARADFENRFTADVNYRSLLAIYERAIDGVTASPLSAAE